MLTRLDRVDGTPHASLLAPEADQTLDITIEFKGERPDAEMQLKVTADIKEAKYKIRKSKERIIRRISHQKM